MECSELNHYLFTINIIDNPLCICGRNETTNHFFIACPQNHLHRVVLVDNLPQRNLYYNLDTLLHGTRDSLLDLQLISLLDTFITASKRFAKFANKELVRLIFIIFWKLLSCLTHWRSILYYGADVSDMALFHLNFILYTFRTYVITWIWRCHIDITHPAERWTSAQCCHRVDPPSTTSV